MEPAIVLNITIAAILIGVTGLALYTSFGPPAKNLADPFDDHDD